MSTKTNESSALQLFLSGTTVGFLLGGIVLLLLVPTAVHPIQTRLKQWGLLLWNAVGLGVNNTTTTTTRGRTTAQPASGCSVGTSHCNNVAEEHEQWLDDPYETEVGY
jgi:hypothetical protein